MKRFLLMLSLVSVVVLAGAPSLRAADPGSGPGNAPPGAPQAFGATLDIGYCYDYLAPFGSWISLDPYGYVWCPRHMGYGWRPYSDGDWIWTDYGWTWMSDLDWGWMPFHYGRWGWDDDCGWFWAPGTVWGPAWVTWRWSDLYFGWAPIPPGFDFRRGIDFDAMALGIPLNFWVFVGGSHFLDRDMHRYVLPYERNATIVRNTEIRNNFDFRGDRMVNNGIDPETIRRVTGHSVLRYSLADSDRPGAPQVSGREARLYRPSISEAPSARPKEFLNRDQARRELAPARIFEPRPQERGTAPESAVRKSQAEQRSLLMQSQAEEQKSLEQSRAQEASRMKSAEEKARVQQDYQARMAEQKKQHQAEQQQMNERHRQEAEQVRQSGQSRQPPPPAPPKKK
ncbi:MAG: DUF6600 domain-containing protein [Candidatus Aminicenantales bacterium]